MYHNKCQINHRELSHTVRTMTFFCDGPVFFPKHVTFPPDLAPSRTNSNSNSQGKNAAISPTDGEHSGENIDLSLSGAVRRHVQFVYQQANHNQRRTAKLLGILRATLARPLRKAAQN